MIDSDNNIEESWDNNITKPMDNHQTTGKVEKKLSLWSKFYPKRWFKVSLLALLIVLLGATSSLAVYFLNKKKTQTIGSSAITTQPTTSPSAPTPTVSESTSPAPSSSPSPSANPSQTTNSNNNSSSNSPNNSSNSNQTKTINNSAIKLTTKSYGYCKALAPESWAFTSNAEASGADLWDPEQKRHAGWGIAFVYSALYPEEESFLRAYLPLAGCQNLNFTSGPQDIGYGFIYRDGTCNGSKGGIVYKKYDSPALGGYVMSIYSAATEDSLWEKEGGTVLSAAISIRCTTQLKSSASSSSSYSGSSSKSEEDNLSTSDKWEEATMGYENVYNPNTGDHFQAPNSSYWDTGPQGAGYYYQNGNDLTKLSRGFGSY